MRILITGAAGFVGPHVASALRRVLGKDVELVLTSKHAPDGVGDEVAALDVTDQESTDAIITQHRPTHVIHLAGIAAPSVAAGAPDVAWRVNLNGTLNLARAILTKAPDCFFINAGSGLVYGDSAKRGLPLDETALLAPVDDYGVSKAAADLALGALSRRGLRCVRMRPFNHIGPGQTEDFVISSFAMQIARIEAGQSEPIIRVGNLAAERDFLDVRDVAEAYALAVDRSDMIAPGTILNLASGTARRISDMLDMLLSLSQVAIGTEQDPGRMRPSDLARVLGNAERARILLGWTPKRSLEQTLADVLAECRARVASSTR